MKRLIIVTALAVTATANAGIIGTLTLEDGTAKFTDNPCANASIRQNYPYAFFGVDKNGTKTMENCYAVVNNGRQFMVPIKGQDVYVETSALDNAQPRRNTADAVVDATNKFVDGIQRAQSIANASRIANNGANNTPQFAGDQQFNCVRNGNQLNCRQY